MPCDKGQLPGDRSKCIGMYRNLVSCHRCFRYTRILRNTLICGKYFYLRLLVVRIISPNMRPRNIHVVSNSFTQ